MRLRVVLLPVLAAALLGPGSTLSHAQEPASESESKTEGESSTTVDYGRSTKKLSLIHI